MGSYNNILQLINRIDNEDLYLIEKDLCFHEKVSLGFLLFADKKSNAQFILQKLLVTKNSNSNQTKSDTDILINYTKINKNWKPFLVEALSVIQANKVLRKLGFHLQDIKPYFLPHRPEISLHINRIVKALLAMCEMLVPSEAGKLVQEILVDTNMNLLPFYDYENLEIFLLDWITKGLLDVSGSETTNISKLIQYFKLHERFDIKDLLNSSLDHISLDTQHSERKSSLEVRPMNENDSSNANKAEITQPNLSGCYPIKFESAGFILIINQRDFHQSTDPKFKEVLPKPDLITRLGTDIDKKRLEETFSSFGYKPVLKDNLNHIEVRQNIREIVKRSIRYDSLIVCILTHGLDGSVYACDSVPIKIDEIEKILTGESLTGKPKMLIIQACQGRTVLKNPRPLVGHLETDGDESYAIDYCDMMKAMSTVSGFASLRHTRDGSWFIQTLCEKINEFGDRDHMLDILTEVNNAVSIKRGFRNEGMTPISSQTLRKKFRLPRRVV